MTAEPYAVVIEDSPSMAALFAQGLKTLMPTVMTAGSLAEARLTFGAGVSNLAAVLLDLHLPDGDGLSLLEELRSRGSDAAIVVVTAHGSINVAVQAVRAGADDFLVKPFAPERLMTTMRNALERRRLTRLVRNVAPGVSESRFEGFVGADLAMQGLYRMVDQAARSKATVFITGESGTGKEVCAEAVHCRSNRRDAPFVALNCAAIPKDLIESEIFGHLKGAFTGATSDRDGAAIRADRGTLFLDETCEMELATQAKLLRFLQTGMVQRVGSDKLVKVDARIICATNRDPMAEVESGRFREDLYYRLHVVPLHIPALRERGEDALLIARHFLAEYAREEGRRFTGFDPAAETVLRSHRWPGNVRQLQNVVRQLVVLHDGEMVTAEMLPAGFSAIPLPATPPEPGLAGRVPLPETRGHAQSGNARHDIRPLAWIERDAIESAIAACDGNMTEAAQRLGISVKTVYRKRQAWDEAASLEALACEASVPVTRPGQISVPAPPRQAGRPFAPDRMPGLPHPPGSHVPYSRDEPQRR